MVVRRLPNFHLWARPAGRAIPGRHCVPPGMGPRPRDVVGHPNRKVLDCSGVFSTCSCKSRKPSVPPSCGMAPWPSIPQEGSLERAGTAQSPWLWAFQFSKRSGRRPPLAALRPGKDPASSCHALQAARKVRLRRSRIGCQLGRLHDLPLPGQIAPLPSWLPSPFAHSFNKLTFEDAFAAAVGGGGKCWHFSFLESILGGRLHSLLKWSSRRPF